MYLKETPRADSNSEACNHTQTISAISTVFNVTRHSKLEQLISNSWSSEYANGVESARG